MSRPASSPFSPRGARQALVWILPALAIVALAAGTWLWLGNGSTPPAYSRGPVLLTDATAPPPHGSTVLARSRPFTVLSRRWTAYWSYYCLIPGVISNWSVQLWLVGKGSPPSTRLINAASKGHGPVSFTAFLHEPGPGTFQFVVRATAHCVWSLRAPPIGPGEG